MRTHDVALVAPANRRAAVIAMTALVLPATAWAQAPVFPDRRVRYVVPYAPGGPTDAVARLVASELASLWDQPVLVDNRPGANGVIGADFVAKSPPDGYTLLQGTSSTHGSNPVVFARIPYDAAKDFVPVVPLIEGPVYLCVAANSRFHSVAGLVAYARARPGLLNYGTSGIGSPQHLAGELLKSRARIDVVPVHYNGAAPALLALQRGEIDFYFDSTGPLQESAGRARILGVTSAQRWPLAPSVPTMAEGGIDDFVLAGWFGLFAPAGTPARVVDRINESVNHVLMTDSVASEIHRLGYRPRGGSSARFAEAILAERSRWADLVRTNNIKVE